MGAWPGHREAASSPNMGALAGVLRPGDVPLLGRWAHWLAARAAAWPRRPYRRSAEGTERQPGKGGRRQSGVRPRGAS